MTIKSAIGIIVNGTVSLIYLFLVIKLLGKKQISELNIFDYIIGLSLGNLAGEMTLSDEIGPDRGILAMSVYAVVALSVTILTAKSIKARRFISGYPVVLMDKGKISKENLKKVKIDINDFLQDARENGYFDISEIECAVMEVSGKVSFMPKSKYTNVTNNDLKIKTDYKGLTANLIIDGKIMKNNLKQINKDEKWLITRLNNMGYYDTNKIFLAICDSKEKITVYLTDTKINKKILE